LEEAEWRALNIDDTSAHRCRAARNDRPREPFLTEVAPIVEELRSLATALADVDPRFRDGTMTLVMVDLARVIATQSIVATDEQRVSELSDPPTLAETAAITLPIVPAVLPTTGYDDRAQSWVVRSHGSTVAVTGRYLAAADANDPGAQCFGFLISAQPSRVTVALEQGRVVLRDGHHRAVALLARGVRLAPVALDSSPSPPVGSGQFARSVVHGQDPPLVSDYLDAKLRVEVEVQRTERVIVVAATELDLPA
jgi:hypothetical protein